MALTVKQLLDFSWMSQASYLDFAGLVLNDIGLIDKLKFSTINANNKFVTGQATTFTDPTTGYNFISHIPNTDSGFSATIFKSNADNSYTIAVRGTEPEGIINSADLVEDALGVVLTKNGVRVNFQ